LLLATGISGGTSKIGSDHFLMAPLGQTSEGLHFA